MPMRFFWPSDSRSSDKASLSSPPVTELPATEPPALPPKRRRPSAVDTSFCPSQLHCAKRVKTEQPGGLPSPVSASADGDDASVSRRSSAALDPESVKDVIQSQFGLEILLKHDELRLINQELAKCQVALEQLRRCHLMPYPVQCPTPGQMLDISSGKGPALQARSGQSVPKWAPPFGVVEGPYARHYAKWLIPDPAFDGMQPEPYVSTEGSRARNVEGRTTRNSMDVGSFGKRAGRGLGGQRLQSLSSGYPQPKDKQGPCVLKRSDGVTVKLVCIDCHRWDFSSTQGFINHCRIAHRRDFKSHDEAAVHCGHPIEVDETGGIVGDEGQKAAANPASGLVHPLLSNEPVSEQQAYKALQSRIRASLDLYHAGKLPNVDKIPTRASGGSSSFVASSDTPYLSQLMKKKKLSGNLSEQVTDAKTKVDWDLFTTPLDDSDLDQPGTSDYPISPKPSTVPAARTPAVMRVPARSAASPPPSAAAPRPASSKGRTPTHLGLAPVDGSVSSEFPETPIYDDDMDVDLSPNTMTSNNAPSLVSDDGEYDDSDDGSASDTSDVMDAESVSDVAEINIEDDVQVVGARQIPHCRPPKPTAVNLKKEESRHVTFVSPIATKNKTKGRRKEKV